MKTLTGYATGIYLGTWLEQCFRKAKRGRNFADREKIAEIASVGVFYVQLPIDYHLIVDENQNFVECGFTYIDKLVRWCGEFGVKLVLEVCIPKQENEKNEWSEGISLQETVCKIWEELAVRYGRYSDRVAFEFPTCAVEHSAASDAWGKITDMCISRVRKLAPDTLVFV